MALRRYSEFYSNSYSYGNKHDTVRTTYAVLRAASKQNETGKKDRKLKSHKKKGITLESIPVYLGVLKTKPSFELYLGFNSFVGLAKLYLMVKNFARQFLVFDDS